MDLIVKIIGSRTSQFRSWYALIDKCLRTRTIILLRNATLCIICVLNLVYAISLGKLQSHSVSLAVLMPEKSAVAILSSTNYGFTTKSMKKRLSQHGYKIAVYLYKQYVVDHDVLPQQLDDIFKHLQINYSSKKSIVLMITEVINTEQHKPIINIKSNEL